MNNYFTKFLGLENVCVDNFEETINSIKINLSTSKHSTSCPCCLNKTDKVHDYRIQRIKDLPYRSKPVYLQLKKRRYLCPHCGKRFFEKYAFLPKYHHMTLFMKAFYMSFAVTYL